MGELVGISTDLLATFGAPQRKSFYAAGRFWVFYSDGTNMVYRTSTDGIKWEDPIIIRECSQGFLFSIWFDETYLHYAYSSEDETDPLYYRRGTPESDGTIDWSGVPVQTAVVGALNVSYYYPIVSVDSNGYPWIGYTRRDLTGWFPFATRSDNNNGTWSGIEVPDQLSVVSRLRFVSVVPLTGGEMLAVYAGYVSRVNARRWNGAIWGIELSTSSKVFLPHQFNAGAEGDDVHLVFLSIIYSLVYVKYDYSSNSFMAEKNLLTGTSGWPSPVLSICKNNNLYVFWGGYPEANTVYYFIYTAKKDTWGPVVKWKSEEKLYVNSLTCFYKQYSDYTGLAYMTNSTSPYKVKFNYIGPPPTPEPKVESQKLTGGGSRHTTPKQGSIGKRQSFKNTRISRHITWVPVVITRA